MRAGGERILSGEALEGVVGVGEEEDEHGARGGVHWWRERLTLFSKKL